MIYFTTKYDTRIILYCYYHSTDVPLCSCKELKDKGYTKSGLYRINLDDDKGEFTVFCDMNLVGGGWTIIQRRVDNSTSFDRTRKEYNVGFGGLNSNFWLGLKKIKRITDGGTHELYVGLESFLPGASQLAWSKYGSFGLGTDDLDYPISISSYDSSSTAGDAFVNHDGEKFSTPDEDNDSAATHCADTHSSGWWYHDCHDSHLNGIYYWDGTHPTSTADGIIWDKFLPDTRSMKTVVMAVRLA